MYESDKKPKETKTYKGSRCRKRRALFALHEKQQEETKYQKKHAAACAAGEIQS